MEAVQTMISSYCDGQKSLQVVLQNCHDDIEYYLMF